MYSNTVEGCLLSIALAYWPLNLFEAKQMNVSFSVALASLAIVIRPTAIICWFYLGICYALFDIAFLSRRFWEVVCLQVIPIFFFSISASVLIDSYFYNQWELVDESSSNIMQEMHQISIK